MWWRRQADKSARVDDRRLVPADPPRGHRQDVQGRRGRGDACAARRHARHRPRRVRVGLRPVGLRQVDAAGDPGAARVADDRALLAQRPRRRPVAARRARAAAQRRDRPHLPELQPDWRHDGPGERRVPADAARRLRQGARRAGPVGAGPGRPHARAPASGPASSLAATSSSSRSRARLPGGRRFSSRTNRPATWTRRAATR